LTLGVYDIKDLGLGAFYSVNIVQLGPFAQGCHVPHRKYPPFSSHSRLFLASVLHYLQERHQKQKQKKTTKNSAHQARRLGVRRNSPPGGWFLSVTCAFAYTYANGELQPFQHPMVDNPTQLYIFGFLVNFVVESQRATVEPSRFFAFIVTLLFRINYIYH